ncbi:MAG: hypothetical protein HOP12_11445 [Candidatus Eisenbacteria bacterium]|uniref:Outer membrane protein beta-barrel domain-containing protein n=1 Tax=Eiseniibacteriota bacterium TaxID=2212470 RepID=A0A849STQ7_UNCEI|nr:hypothetical protein [Candidatus Eisenbacteria bacterium]
MVRARLSLIVCLLLTGLQATNAHAFLDPYIRVGIGGNQLKMDDVNDAIANDVDFATSGGVPVSAHNVGPGYGPTVSAGLWLVPFLRVGATYGEQRARVTHEYRNSGFLYQENYEFRMKETGFEAALRIPSLAGLSFGGTAVESRGDADEHFALENVHGKYYEDFASQRTSRTYSAFMGLEQTAANGVAGFLQVGYHWREFGPMPGTLTTDDNGTITVVPGETVPVDYSGWSVRLGAGFDLKW